MLQISLQAEQHDVYPTARTHPAAILPGREQPCYHLAFKKRVQINVARWAQRKQYA